MTITDHMRVMIVTEKVAEKTFSCDHDLLEVFTDVLLQVYGITTELNIADRK
jgi:hypothetical protein